MGACAADGKQRTRSQGNRPCAAFRYVGDPVDASAARGVLAAWEDGGLGPQCAQRAALHVTGVKA